MPAVVKVIQGGAPKPRNNPYTICVIANPYLEAPWQSGQFVPDPITTAQASFDTCTSYIVDSICGRLPGQREVAFASLAPTFRVVSIFDDTLPLQDSNALVAQDGVSNLVVARQVKFASFIARYSMESVISLKADVAFAVSASATHTRSSAWYTHDNDGGAGVSFTLDGVALSHRFNNVHPGTVALHNSSISLVALHEFGHAASSFTNGSVTDLYVDSSAALNNKRGRPIPSTYGSLKATTYSSDLSRDGLGYPSNWQSYHCELNSTAFPAVMDNFWQSSTVPEDCEHDHITRRFLVDRISAIMSRP